MTPSSDPDGGPIGGRRVLGVKTRIPLEHYFVAYFRPRDNVRCGQDGNPLTASSEAGSLFDSLEEATAFAKAGVQSNGNVGTCVYDSSWRMLAQFIDASVRQRQERRTDPSRLLFWASALLIAGSVCLWLEVRSGWTLLVGFLIGLRLLLSGFLKLVSGVHEWRRRALRLQ